MAVPKKILVIGGTGFIGKHLVEKLADEAHDVRVLSRNIPRGHDRNDKVEYLSGSFLSMEHVKHAMTGVDTVYHLAVTTAPGWSNDLILYDAQTNLMGSLNLIQAAAEAEIRRFVFVSSGGSVYGPTQEEAITEDHPTDPISAHGVGKLAVEKYLEIYRRKSGLEYRIARAGNPYGEYQDPAKGQGFIAYGLGQLVREAEIVIWGDGSVVRDFFYVGDLVEALYLMLDDDSPHRVYNVGSGQGRSLNEIIDLLEAVTDRTVKLRYEAGRAADVPYNTLDITRIKQGLNWKPQVDLLSGLKRSWVWFLSYINSVDVVPL